MGGGEIGGLPKVPKFSVRSSDAGSESSKLKAFRKAADAYKNTEQPKTIKIDDQEVTATPTEANKYKLTWPGDEADGGVIVEIKGENDFLITNANGTDRNDPAADESIKQALFSSPLNLEFKPPELKPEAEIEVPKVVAPPVNLKDNQSYKDLEVALSSYLETMADTKQDPRDKKAALQSAIVSWAKQAGIPEATRTQVEQIVITQTTIAEIERHILKREEKLEKLISEKHNPIDAPDEQERSIRKEIENLSTALKEKELSLIRLVYVSGADGNKLIESYVKAEEDKNELSSDLAKLFEKIENVDNSLDRRFTTVNEELTAEGQARENLEKNTATIYGQLNTKIDSLGDSVASGISTIATTVAGELDKIRTELGKTETKVKGLETELGKRVTMPVAGGLAALAGLVGAGLSYFGLKPTIDKAVQDATAKASNTTATPEDSKKKKA